MGSLRFEHIPDNVVRRYREFPAMHPGTIPPHVLLQKLVIFDFIAPLVADHPHGSILEIGAGLGIHSALLSRYGSVSSTDLASPGSFVGADRDVEVLRTFVFEELSDGPVAFSHQSDDRLPYNDDSFDIVFHNSVIEHVPDVTAFNNEVRRVLRPGGICICITGTPILCRFRLIKDWLLRLPLHAAVAVVREVPLLRELAVGVLRLLGVSDITRQKVRERLLRVDDRLRAVTGNATLTEHPETCRKYDLTAFHPRLFHFLYFPDYNRIVAENAAQELGVSVDELFACLDEHFCSVVNRLRFAMAPQTHGQHYRNVWDEMREWRPDRWRQQFEQTGFQVEDIQGYRYHHMLELTPIASWNTALYARAARLIRFSITRRLFEPSCASEIIIVARKVA